MNTPHVLDSNDVRHRDTATCLTEGCETTIRRCDHGDTWPWDCLHCGPTPRPTILDRTKDDA